MNAMSDDISKQTVKNARKKLESMDLVILGWRDKYKEEHIRCYGEKDDLEAAEKEMAQQGWIVKQNRGGNYVVLDLFLHEQPVNEIDVSKPANETTRYYTVKERFRQYYIAIAVFILVGLFVGCYAATNISLMNEGHDWIAGQATLDSAKIQKHGGGYRSISPITYFPIVNYHFSVNGEQYTGNHFSIPESGFLNEKDAATALQTYISNTTISIFFNPRNPTHNSVMLPHPHQMWIIVYETFIALCFLAAIVYAIFGKPKIHRKK